MIYLTNLLYISLRSGGGLLLDVCLCWADIVEFSATGTSCDPEHQAVWKIIEDISVLKLI